MANSEERYSLEEILAEFKLSGEVNTAAQTAEKLPPAAEPASGTESPSISDEEMRRQEEALAAKMDARRKAKEAVRPPKEEPSVEETILNTVDQVKREKAAMPPEERMTAQGQITMKFPAVKEMRKQAESRPKQEPLKFEPYARSAPKAEEKAGEKAPRDSAPWRTATPAQGHRVAEHKEEKKEPRLRTFDLSSEDFSPESAAFDPEEPENARRPRRRLSYDRVNRPVEDAGQAALKLGKRLGGMAARLLLFFPIIVTSLYLTAAAGYGLPMPAGYTFAEQPMIHLGVLAFCQLMSLILCHESTVGGLWRLVMGRPTLDTALTLAGLINLAYCGVAAFLPQWLVGVPYVCVTAVSGFFALLSKRQRYEALRRNYKALNMGTAPTGVKLYTDGKAQDLAVKTQSGVDVDTAALAEPDFTERYAAVYSPIALVLAVALSLVASVGKGETCRLLWSLSALLSVSTPMCLLLSSSAGAKRLGKKLYTSGSMIINARAAGRLAKSHAAVLRDADLYPAGSVKITGMKIAENQEPELVVGCAASLLQEVGGGLSRAFTEFARQMFIVPNKAKELRFFDTRGIAATVGGKYVQLGTASYLMRMGIRVTEGLKLQNSIFIAIDSQFAGIFSMRHEVQTPVYSAFGLLKHGKIRPVLALRDTTQTQNTVEEAFELRRDTAYQPPLEERLRYSASSFGKEEETLALLSRDGLMPFAEVLSAAKKWRKSARQSCVMGTLCALFGMLLLAFLTGEGAVNAASPFNVLAYLLLWSLPAKLMRGIVNRL